MLLIVIVLHSARGLCSCYCVGYVGTPPLQLKLFYFHFPRH